MILTNGITAYEASGDKTIYLEDLNLPMRIYNPLRVAGYKTAAQINAVRNRDGLRRLSRMGEKSIDDIISALVERIEVRKDNQVDIFFRMTAEQFLAPVAVSA